MPKLSTTAVPSYRHHKPSGQAVVTLNGRDIYLGDHGTKESREKYDRLISEWTARNRAPIIATDSITIIELVAAYRRFIRSYYLDHDGKPTKAVTNIEESLRPVLKLYGRTHAAEFGPLKLKAVRDAMINAGIVRTNINRHVVRIRGAFKWAVENELIPPSVLHGLMAVRGLQAGRGGAKESEKVKPVAREHVETIASHVSRQVAAMLKLQMLTGMRPGEVCRMTTGEIDTTGSLWVYRPATHKTAHHGHSREVFLGPKAQEIIATLLKPDLQAFIFNPSEAETERRAMLCAERKTPLSCGNRLGTNRQRKPKREPGNRYTPGSYYRAIIRGCDKAFPPPPELLSEDKAQELVAWRHSHRFHPHQCRHTFATDARKQYGVEAAQILLGHATLQATQIYAERNAEVARKIVGELG